MRRRDDFVKAFKAYLGIKDEEKVEEVEIGRSDL